MGRINVDYLEPGMILAAEVRDRSGRVLLGPGQEITEKNLRVFRIWGVLEADVQGVEKESVDAKTMAQLDPERLRIAEEEFGTLFRHTDRTDPVVQELFRIATVRQVKQQMEGTDNGQ
ncbi:MAG: hypothetical protein NTV54_15110 [Ignavibacteriales bacterium]|nr:hypothetical protein [Ignavibacteriales bacterium]